MYLLMHGPISHMALHTASQMQAVQDEHIHEGPLPKGVYKQGALTQPQERSHPASLPLKIDITDESWHTRVQCNSPEQSLSHSFAYVLWDVWMCS